MFEVGAVKSRPYIEGNKTKVSIMFIVRRLSDYTILYSPFTMSSPI